VTSLVASAVQVVIAMRRLRGGVRVVDEIAVLARLGDELVVSSAWARSTGVGVAGDRLAELLSRGGVAVPTVLR
jgi:hypothetical protein